MREGPRQLDAMIILTRFGLEGGTMRIILTVPFKLVFSEVVMELSAGRKTTRIFRS